MSANSERFSPLGGSFYLSLSPTLAHALSLNYLKEDCLCNNGTCPKVEVPALTKPTVSAGSAWF